MNQLFLTLFSVMTLASCTSTDGSNQKGQESETQTVAQETAVDQQDVKMPEGYVNGVNDQNRGDKRGPIHVYGTLPANARGKMMYLYITEGKNHQLLDSTQINGTEFDFGTEEYNRGFYMLGLDGNANNMMAVILNPDESEVDVNFSSARLEVNPQSSVSKENEGWFAYRQAEKVAENAIKNLRRQRSSSSFKERIDQQIGEKEAELRAQQATFIEQYPGTFLAKFLTWKNSPYKSQKGKYWKDIDFSDESLVRMPILQDRIQEFMRTHSGGSESGFLNCVDLVKAEAELNPRVLEFALYTMLDGFYQSNLEDISLYILDNYILEGDCSADISDVIKKRAMGIRNLQIGNTPPDFTIESTTGEQVNLMSEVKKHEYTLVMFWASWCHKCEQEIPVLKNVYSAYNNRGFGVVGVSVDNARAAWLKAVEENGVEWPNVSQLQMWDSPVAEDYRVTSTPALFLLNSKGEIVDKPKRIYQVEQFLSKNL